MNHMQKTIGVFAFLALAISLVGCSTATVVAPPTPDIPSIRTESVQTVVAKLTIEAALNPTATQEPTQTSVPEATATTAPTATLAVVALPTSTLIPTANLSSGGSSVSPTATRRPGPDQAQYVSQDPQDGTLFQPGNTFDGTWTVKNIGTSTWDTHYKIRFGGGTNLALKSLYYLKGTVAPGDTVKLITDMQAPSTAGRYVSYWQLLNANGDIFYQFYLIIDVR